MPTGYTAKIAEGIEFPEFALTCSRNFGALVTMRDDPSGAEIPDVIKPSDFYLEKANEARAEIARLEAMTAADAEVEAEREHAEAVRDRDASLVRRRELRTKYEAMLVKIQAWKPPTSDHQGLKDFMLSQVRESIPWDCSPSSYDTVPKRASGSQWRTSRLNELRSEVVRYEIHYAEECQRAFERTNWIQELKKSLGLPINHAT